MSFRRFVYLITNDSKWSDFPLYRIDTSRLFFPIGTQLSYPPPAKETPLPSPDFRFRPPVSEYVNGSMGFVLFGSGENQSHQVLATDQTGRAVLSDPETRSVRTLPSLAAPKENPVSFSVGNDLYILDSVLSYTTSGSCACYHCFDGLVFGADRSTQSHNDWYCHALPPPPYVHEYRWRS